MSADISTNDFRFKFINKFHSNKVSFEEVKKLGIDVNKHKDADNVKEDQEFEITEIVNDKDLYAAFTAILQEDDNDVDVDPEKEKENDEKVQNSGNAKNK